jgi:hypothetical protein
MGNGQIPGSFEAEADQKAQGPISPMPLITVELPSALEV